MSLRPRITAASATIAVAASTAKAQRGGSSARIAIPRSSKQPPPNRITNPATMKLRPCITAVPAAAADAHRCGSSATKAVPRSLKPAPPNPNPKPSIPRPLQSARNSKLPHLLNSSTRKPISRPTKPPSAHAIRSNMGRFMPPKESNPKLSTNPVKLSVPITSTEPRARFNHILPPKGMVRKPNKHPCSASTRKLSIPSSLTPHSNVPPSRPRPPPQKSSIPCRSMQNPQAEMQKPLLNKLPQQSTLDPLPRWNQQKPSRKSVTKVCNLRSGPPPSFPVTPKKKTIEVEKKAFDTPTPTATPPVKRCISPEIRQPALVAPLSVCYANGHLLAGVPDGRRCKPRGLLITGGSRMEVEGAPAVGEAIIQWYSSHSKEVNPIDIAMIRSAMWHEDYAIRSYNNQKSGPSGVGAAVDANGDDVLKVEGTPLLTEDPGNWSSDGDDDLVKVEEVQPLVECAMNWSSEDCVYMSNVDGAEPLLEEVRNWSSDEDVVKVEESQPLVESASSWSLEDGVFVLKVDDAEPLAEEVGNWSSDEDDDLVKVEDSPPLVESAGKWSSEDDVWNWPSNYDDLLKVKKASPHPNDVQNWFSSPSTPLSMRDAGNSLTRRALWRNNCLYSPQKSDADGMVNYLDDSPQNFKLSDDDGMVKYIDSPPKDPHWDFLSSAAKSPSSGCVFLGRPYRESHLSPFTAMIQQAEAARARLQFGSIADNLVVKNGRSSPQGSLMIHPLMIANKQQRPSVPLKEISCSTSVGSLQDHCTCTKAHQGVFLSPSKLQLSRDNNDLSTLQSLKKLRSKKMIKHVSGPHLESTRVKKCLTFGLGMNLETKKVEENLSYSTSISPFLGVQHQVATVSGLVPLESRQQNQFILSERCLPRSIKAESHLRTMENPAQNVC